MADVTVSDLYPGVPTDLERQVSGMGATGDRYQMEYRMLPMRDGVRLATIVIRPRAAGRVPVIMERTPYTSHLPYDVYKRAFAAGWAVVIQNERGTGWSDGDFSVLGSVASDCADTLTWIAAQDWSNGCAALLGCSSPAENQLRLSAQGHPALRCSVPMSSGAGVGDIPGCEGSQGLFYKGGVPVLSTWSSWYAPSGFLRRPHLSASEDPDELARAMRSFSVSSPSSREPEYAARLARTRMRPPSGDILRRMGVPASGFDTYMGCTPADPVWGTLDLINAEHTGATPALNINGWMDVGAYETVKLYEFQQHHPDQYLIMAASSHCAMIRAQSPQAMLGDRPVGNTVFPYDDIIMAWFRRFLAGDEAAWKPMPRVQVYLMGASRWLTGERWPLPETRVKTLHLNSGGSANTLWGDGVLQDAPAEGGSDRFIADPDNPVQTLGGGLGMDPICLDQRPVECRSDVLVYSTPPLDRGVAVVGDVDAVLHISTDVIDTDVFIKLVDVYPDGTAYNLAWSCLRLRYRDGYAQPSRLTPGAIYEIRIRGITTANYFGPGHRIRLEVAGSNFPLADRNWHTGGANEKDTSGPIAHITLHHDRAHPSRIELREYTESI